MRIAFFMPGAARVIRGGFKVLFKYANCLAERGHDVTVFFPASNAENRSRGLGSRLVHYAAGRVWARIYSPDDWARLHGSIRTRWIWRGRPQIAQGFALSIVADRAAAADVLVGHGGEHRVCTGGYRGDGDPLGRKTLYVFQEFEYYMSGDEATRRAIEAALRRAGAVIAVSPAAREAAERVRGKERVYQVDNGVELERFLLTGPPPGRERARIGFAFREEPLKRTRDIVSALSTLDARGKLSGLTCWAYGTSRAPRLPSWVDYAYRPSDARLCERLNDTAIFVVASSYEGWGLPGAEAMACGAALVTSRNGGCEVYARHMENALLFPPEDAMQLVGAIERLIDEPGLRARLAAEGHRSIQRFGWPAACARFLEVVMTLFPRAESLAAEV